jgi:hypothetical protein
VEGEIMRIVQIVALLLGAFFIYKSIILLKARREDLFYFILWTGIGVTLILGSVWYDFVIEKVLTFSGMTNRVNLLFSGTALLCMFIIFMMFKEIRIINENVSKLNEELALLNHRRKKR